MSGSRWWYYRVMPGTAIYLRISSDPSTERAGVTRQRFDCEMIVAKRGWPEPVFYEDNDVSAWSGKRRPEWERLLADLPSLDAVVAWDLDRLVRQPRDLEKFLDACDAAKVHRVATAQGDLDLTSDAGRFTARILAAVATKESDDKSRRIRRAKQDAAERGRWQGSHAPFGYRHIDGHLVLEPDEAAVVVEAYRHVLDGGSVRALVGRGGPKSHPGWRDLLLSPTIAGRTSTGHEGGWEPIVSVETWARVRAVLTDPARRKHRTTERQHWLAGLLICGHCEAGMVHNARERKGVDYSRYICSAKRHLSIAAGPVEEFMEGLVLATSPMVRSAPSSLEPPPEGGAPLGSPQQRLDEMTALYVAGKLTRTAWEAAYIAAQEVPVVVRDAPKPTLTITAEAWASWSPTERYWAARQLLDAVVVLPGAAPLEDRLDFRWIA
jgi:site-specific DNA recombinase